MNSFCQAAIFSSKDFNLPSGEHVDKLWVGVPGRVDIVLQVKIISTKNVKLKVRVLLRATKTIKRKIALPLLVQISPADNNGF